ncbi:MAG: hypothetical protein ACOYT9_04270 [Patescibacteria group bacterium]
MKDQLKGVEFFSNLIGGIGGIAYILVPVIVSMTSPAQQQVIPMWMLPLIATVFGYISLIEPWIIWRFFQILVTIVPSCFMLLLLAFPEVGSEGLSFWGTIIGGALLFLFNLFQVLLSILKKIDEASKAAQANDPFISAK